MTPLATLFSVLITSVLAFCWLCAYGQQQRHRH